MIATVLLAVATLAIPPLPQRGTGEVPIPAVPAKFVTDNVHAISAATQEQLEDQLEAFARRTTDQVVVWIGDSTGDTPLEEWTVKAAQKWRVGQRGRDNGAVLFLFMKDRRVRIEAGYGLEATLTDAASAQIERETIEPALRRGNTDEAVTSGVAAILQAIDTGSPPPPKRSLFDFVGLLWHWARYALGAIILLVIGLAFFGDIWTWLRTGNAKDLDDDFGPASARLNQGGGYSRSGGGGGGGFSGGGGSFGGGGASGGW